MTNHLIVWYHLMQQPKFWLWTIVLLAACMVLALIVSAIYELWLDHEQQKTEQAEQTRIELERVMALTHDLDKRGPKGWANRNGRMAG